MSHESAAGIATGPVPGAGGPAEGAGPGGAPAGGRIAAGLPRRQHGGAAFPHLLRCGGYPALWRSPSHSPGTHAPAGPQPLSGPALSPLRQPKAPLWRAGGGGRAGAAGRGGAGGPQHGTAGAGGRAPAAPAGVSAHQ
ncbi:hypothetical protein B5G34_16320 [Flavonifractor sp. An82]|nr:hypothetical protein B5G34_16320 [Flavonifractor sp. An82]